MEVANRLALRKLPPEVKLVELGIRGFDLAYALLDGYDVNILIDATARGSEPGTLYTIEIDPHAAGESGMDGGAHGMNPMRVLQMAEAMGGCPGRVLLVGCEPETLGSEEEGLMGLSATVDAAADRAVGVVEKLVGKLLVEDRNAAA